VIVHNACPVFWRVLGEVSKLVVEYNAPGGNIFLGNMFKQNSVTTEEVVIRSNEGEIGFYHKVKSIEVQNNANYISAFGEVTGHIDIKNNDDGSKLDFVFTQTCPDLWIGKQCGTLNYTRLNSSCEVQWENYINDSNC